MENQFFFFFFNKLKLIFIVVLTTVIVICNCIRNCKGSTSSSRMQLLFKPYFKKGFTSTKSILYKSACNLLLLYIYIYIYICVCVCVKVAHAPFTWDTYTDIPPCNSPQNRITILIYVYIVISYKFIVYMYNIGKYNSEIDTDGTYDKISFTTPSVWGRKYRKL